MTHADTPIEKFSKDHWSTFAYAETCFVDNAGQLARSRMRTNEARHPLLANPGCTWKPGYSTRLDGYFQFAEKGDVDKAVQAGFQILGHDDWDCLDDLEAAGLVEIESMATHKVKLTKEGAAVAAALRAHKAAGGMFATFQYNQRAI